jgi:predicted ATP-dependent endonuclease of OLD family
MKLVKAHVTNFRSVEDSGKFSVEQVTCLVGKNEAGKSAVLLALGALHPHPSTPLVFDKERDYPRRHLTAYAARHDGGEATTVTTVWQLSPEEIELVRKNLGDGALKTTTVTIYRTYGGKPRWYIDGDNQKVITI